MSILLNLAHTVRINFQPAARAGATATTLEQLDAATPNASPAALLAGWRAVGAPREGDTPAMVARRATCRELVEIMIDDGDTDARSTYADLDAAKPIWDAWFLSFAGSDDPRHRSMALTFARERKEFEGFVF